MEAKRALEAKSTQQDQHDEDRTVRRMLAQVQAARKRASAQSLQRAQSLAVVCGLFARAVECARLGPSGCSPRGQGAPLRPRGSFPRLALACARASIPAAARRGVGARRRRARHQHTRLPRSLGAEKDARRCDRYARRTNGRNARACQQVSTPIRGGVRINQPSHTSHTYIPVSPRTAG